MTIIEIILALLLSEPQTCQATQFGYPGDKLAGGNALLLKRPVAPSDLGLAHRKLALGTVVAVQNPRTGKIAVGLVIDRGPYGAVHEGEWAIKLKRNDPGTWRGCADLTPALGKAIGHNGREAVRLWVVE